ncbi:MAG: cupin domain-containing protein [Sandaracinaceae bacterium]|nr:cupin domain-containing protein [Sandaracinaceae bacterium]
MRELESLGAEELAERLGLAPHPEGGFYRETYRATRAWPAEALPQGAPRAASTAIYFLVPEGSFSALHRIASDELWHFHAGASLEIVAFDPDGGRHDRWLGLALDRGEAPQQVVPAGWLFGARLRAPRLGDAPPWALVGCTVAPGFDFADFELPPRAALLDALPAHHAIVRELTRA